MSDIEDKIARDLNLDNGQGRTARGGRGGKRGGRRGGGGGGGGKGEMNREVAVSKALSKLLRHAAGEAGLVLDSEGFARVDQVMKWPRLKSLQITFEDIREAVADNAKQRFSMKANPSLITPPLPTSTEPSDWVIRANQGHSITTISSEALLIPITEEAHNIPEVVVHGTYFAFYEEIVMSGGLKRMGRNHVHFSTGIPGEDEGVKSGMRKDAELLIYVDIKRSLRDGGVKWWMSENGVVLTEGDEHGFVGTSYWSKVVGKQLGVGVLWEDGKKVADLPESARGRKPPMGKGPRGKGNRGGGRGRGRGGARGVSGSGDLGEEVVIKNSDT